MTTPEPDASAAIVSHDDDRLLQLELKVAQRADKLAEASGRSRGKDLEHWLQAEQEILARCCGEPKPGFAAAAG
jgi:Protein of unknown function (DUF2934)